MEKHLPNIFTGLWVVALCVIALALSRLVRPDPRPSASAVPYDSGEKTQSGPWIRRAPHAHILLVCTAVFVVASSLLFPALVDFRGWVSEGRGPEALLKVSLFLITLATSLAYAWRRGDLDWKPAAGGKEDSEHGSP